MTNPKHLRRGSGRSASAAKTDRIDSTGRSDRAHPWRMPERGATNALPDRAPDGRAARRQGSGGPRGA